MNKITNWNTYIILWNMFLKKSPPLSNRLFKQNSYTHEINAYVCNWLCDIRSLTRVISLYFWPSFLPFPTCVKSARFVAGHANTYMSANHLWEFTQIPHCAVLFALILFYHLPYLYTIYIYENLTAYSTNYFTNINHDYTLN